MLTPDMLTTPHMLTSLWPSESATYVMAQEFQNSYMTKYDVFSIFRFNFINARNYLRFFWNRWFNLLILILLFLINSISSIVKHRLFRSKILEPPDMLTCYFLPFERQRIFLITASRRQYYFYFYRL